jgi:hypothetical protein
MLDIFVTLEVLNNGIDVNEVQYWNIYLILVVLEVSNKGTDVNAEHL